MSYALYCMHMLNDAFCETMNFINSMKHDAFACFLKPLFSVFCKGQMLLRGQGQSFSRGQFDYLRRKSLGILSPFGQTKTVRYLIFTFVLVSSYSKFWWIASGGTVTFFIHTHTHFYARIVIFQHIQDFYFVFSVHIHGIITELFFIVIIAKQT